MGGRLENRRRGRCLAKLRSVRIGEVCELANWGGAETPGSLSPDVAGFLLLANSLRGDRAGVVTSDGWRTGAAVSVSVASHVRAAAALDLPW